MALYAQQRTHRLRQIATDLVVMLWIAAWAVLARSVWGAMLAIAEPARRTASAAARMRDDFDAAGASAGSLPVAGEELRRPFVSASGSVDSIVAAADEQVRTLETLALIGGWLVFVIPVATVLLFWLPNRLHFVRRSRAIERLVDSGADLDLFALRAMAAQPLQELARISADPVGDWRAGRWDKIVQMADLELRTAGMQVPAGLRTTAPHRFADQGDAAGYPPEDTESEVRQSKASSRMPPDSQAEPPGSEAELPTKRDNR